MTLFRPSRFARAALAAVASLLLPSVSLGADAPQSAGTLAEQYLLSAANQERTARGLPPVHRDSQLARAAQQHAWVMAQHGSISHQFPGEPELTRRGASNGVAFSVISENVAEAPSVIQIHDLWMHSEHHRENLLDPAVDAVGISVVNRDGEFFAVEDFAKTVRSASLGEQEAAIGNLVARSASIRIASDADTITVARKTCAMDTGYTGSRKPWFVMRFTSDSLNRLPDELKARLASGRYHEAAIGACSTSGHSSFSSYSIAVLLYP